ncbi:hypothetical protein A2U01_0053436, partial [Trifolium medium]|nr:hypothetical protein [Trifolium medium]
QGDPEISRHIDSLVEKFVEGWEEEEDNGSQENVQFSNTRVGKEVRSEAEEEVIPSMVREGVVTSPELASDHLVRDDDHVSGTGESPFAAGSHSICSPTVSFGRPCRRKRTKSCPPSASRPMLSGPWSLEWLHDLNQGDAGVIFSARKRPR